MEEGFYDFFHFVCIVYTHDEANAETYGLHDKQSCPWFLTIPLIDGGGNLQQI